MIKSGKGYKILYLFLFFIYILLSALIFYKIYDIINYKIKEEVDNMKVYRVTRKIEAFEVDEKALLNHIKECDCSNDEDIHNATSVEELIKNFGGLNDFEDALEDFCNNGEIVANSVLYEDDYDEAWSIFDWGVH